jgi:hypothetical protein
MLLCTRHHTLVHEGGFRIEKDFQDRWTFLRPDGIAVPSFGYHARDMMDEDFSRRAGPRSKVVENPPAGGLLSRAENKVSEAPPPAYLH